MELEHKLYFKVVTDNDGNQKQKEHEFQIGTVKTTDVPNEVNIGNVNIDLTCGVGERFSHWMPIISYEMKNHKKYELENLLIGVYRELKNHEGEAAAGLAERTGALLNAMGIQEHLQEQGES